MFCNANSSFKALFYLFMISVVAEVGDKPATLAAVVLNMKVYSHSSCQKNPSEVDSTVLLYKAV